MENTDTSSGHRERLRKRFLTNKAFFSEVEFVELLLTYAIPRKDVVPVAEALLVHFGGISGVLSANLKEIIEIEGIGEQAAILITAIGALMLKSEKEKIATGKIESVIKKKIIQQPKLFEIEPKMGPLFEQQNEPKMRTFGNDEILTSLRFIPVAAEFETLEGFKTHLEENLPYNSFSTRQRRSHYIINRFFPEGNLNKPLVFFASKCTNEEGLKAAIFYHVLKAEPIASKSAEEIIWPSLPKGMIDKNELRTYILEILPNIGLASQKKTLRSIFYTYDLLGVGKQDGTTLRFQIHQGTLESFLYILSSEFPKPGIYSFDALYDGPMRHWLLWDREWMRLQLYNLQDFGLISKVSEIDTVRQFSLQFDQITMLKTYFEHPKRNLLSIRENNV